MLDFGLCLFDIGDSDYSQRETPKVSEQQYSVILQKHPVSLGYRSRCRFTERDEPAGSPPVYLHEVLLLFAGGRNSRDVL